MVRTQAHDHEKGKYNLSCPLLVELMVSDDSERCWWDGSYRHGVRMYGELLRLGFSDRTTSAWSQVEIMHPAMSQG